ncbi:MAG: hypothetical protein ABR911_05425 [Syntrophales bacterium]
MKKILIAAMIAFLSSAPHALLRTTLPKRKGKTKSRRKMQRKN